MKKENKEKNNYKKKENEKQAIVKFRKKKKIELEKVQKRCLHLNTSFPLIHLCWKEWR